MNTRVSVQADSKLREEEKRALRYLETRRDCNSVQAVSVTTGSETTRCQGLTLKPPGVRVRRDITSLVSV